MGRVYKGGKYSVPTPGEATAVGFHDSGSTRRRLDCVGDGGSGAHVQHVSSTCPCLSSDTGARLSNLTGSCVVVMVVSPVLELGIAEYAWNRYRCRVDLGWAGLWWFKLGGEWKLRSSFLSSKFMMEKTEYEGFLGVLVEWRRDFITISTHIYK